MMNGTSVGQLQQQLAAAHTFLDTHHALFELVFMLGMYSRFAGRTVQYMLSPKLARAAHYPHKTLAVHIAASFLLAARYYVSQLSAAPIPDRLDQVLIVAQLSTSFYLATTVQSSDILYKSSFQGMVLMNAISAALAIATRSPEWYRVFVRCVDWFTYYRWLAVAIRKHKLFSFPKVPYTVSIHLVSAPFTLWVAGYPAGLPIYWVLLVGIMALNQWLSPQSPEPTKEE
ncbi:hypothetical protein NQ176_g1776 [Zarea fungicola]|uniref:Uncharacterized protein n=1 Tax=Zarea fungicola TaxID=93591 RepID=A0ACC1NRZ2_9HYPO|nr:hypothetical protein NQ176_g1776 [Lecanicillium fungicola]